MSTMCEIVRLHGGFYLSDGTAHFVCPMCKKTSITMTSSAKGLTAWPCIMGCKGPTTEKKRASIIEAIRLNPI